MIEKFTISRDDSIYQAWPDVVLLPSGRLVCVFAECTHHRDRSYARIMLTESDDRGRSWSPKRPVTEASHGRPNWNCPRIMLMRDGSLVVLVDKVAAEAKSTSAETCRNYLFVSKDEGQSWGAPVETPALGIVPDKLLELDDGRWILACHYHDGDFGYTIQRLWFSDDLGKTWSPPVIVGKKDGLNLCEVSILPVEDKLVAFMRENSHLGWPCYKTISEDRGESWSEPVAFPLPGCHRPVAGHLRDGRIIITHRFIQGGGRLWGKQTQNFFAALTDDESALATQYMDARTSIMPVDFDRAPIADLGYSGWVQIGDDEIYIVSYIVDDAPKGQIRGYSLRPSDFLLEQPEAPSD